MSLIAIHVLIELKYVLRALRMAMPMHVLSGPLTLMNTVVIKGSLG